MKPVEDSLDLPPLRRCGICGGPAEVLPHLIQCKSGAHFADKIVGIWADLTYPSKTATPERKR